MFMNVIDHHFPAAFTKYFLSGEGTIMFANEIYYYRYLRMKSIITREGREGVWGGGVHSSTRAMLAVKFKGE